MKINELTETLHFEVKLLENGVRRLVNGLPKWALRSLRALR
jgi:hypothetical protein